MKLTINNLCKAFDKKIILDNANYEFESGKIYVLLGRNGAGKTTLFNCINQDLEVDFGKILFEDKPITYEEISYVTSIPAVPEFLTGREFVHFFMDINKKKISFDKTEDEYLESVGIKKEDRDLLIRDYSHGMKTKIQLLVNLMCKTPVLLLDEPLTALDVVAAENMKELLKKSKTDRILIFSTHIMELATTLGDEIVLLHNRKLEKLDNESLNNDELKDKIIQALTDAEEQ